MNDLKAMFEIDFQSALLALVTFMIGFTALRKVFTEFCGWMGLETKFMRDRREQKEEVDYLKKHSEEQDKKIDQLIGGINEMKTSISELAQQVDDMKNAAMEARRNTLRDRIGQSYRYYAQKGEWNSIEKEAFDGLIQSYEQAGGTNGLIHQIIIPAALKWNIVDE